MSGVFIIFQIAMISMMISFLILALVFYFGPKISRYLEKSRESKKRCDLCNTKSGDIIDVWVKVPHFIDKGGSLYISKRPLNGKYTSEIKIASTMQQMCTECFEMCNILNNEGLKSDFETEE